MFTKEKVLGSRRITSLLNLEQTLSMHQGCVNTLSWSDCGNLLLSGSDDTHIGLWEAETGRLLADICTGHSENIFGVKFMPSSSNSVVLSCSADGQVRIFDLHYANLNDQHRTKKSLRSIYNCHVDRVKRIQTENYNPHVFLTCSDDGSVREFDLRVAHRCPVQCSRPLIIPDYQSMSRFHSFDLNQNFPSYFATACDGSFVFLYDRRYLKTFSSGLRGYVKRFAPQPYSALRGVGRFGPVTDAKFGRHSSHELVASYSADKIYMYDIAGSHQIEYSREASPVASRTRSKERNVVIPSTFTVNHRRSIYESRRTAINLFTKSKNYASALSLFESSVASYNTMMAFNSKKRGKTKVSDDSHLLEQQIGVDYLNCAILRLKLLSLKLVKFAFPQPFLDASFVSPEVLLEGFQCILNDIEKVFDLPCEASTRCVARLVEFLALMSLVSLEPTEDRRFDLLKKAINCLSDAEKCEYLIRKNLETKIKSNFKQLLGSTLLWALSIVTRKGDQLASEMEFDGADLVYSDGVKKRYLKSLSSAMPKKRKRYEDGNSDSEDSHSNNVDSEDLSHEREYLDAFPGSTRNCRDFLIVGVPQIAFVCDRLGIALPLSFEYDFALRISRYLQEGRKEGLLTESDYESDLDELNDDDYFQESNSSNFWAYPAGQSKEEARRWDGSVKSFNGHANVRTIKSCNFYGPQDEFIVSGSDDGNVFFWDKSTRKIVQILPGDEQIVNAVVPNPLNGSLAVSGLSSTVKIFSPHSVKTSTSQIHRADEIIARNADQTMMDLRGEDRIMIYSQMFHMLMNQQADEMYYSEEMEEDAEEVTGRGCTIM